jgi:hypothetical protein
MAVDLDLPRSTFPGNADAMFAIAGFGPPPPRLPALAAVPLSVVFVNKLAE